MNLLQDRSTSASVPPMSNAYHTSATATKPFKGEFPRPCIRCGGTGNCGPRVVFQGRCFRCPAHPGLDPKPAKEWVFPADWSGDKIEEFLAKKEEARQARAAKKIAARRSLMDEQCEAFPALATLRQWQADAPSWDPDADDMTDGDPRWPLVWHVAQDIVSKAFSMRLSEKQVALLVREVENVEAKLVKKEAEAAVKAAAVLPVGKGVTISGNVVGRKWHEGNFGSTLKLTVKLPDGACVWFTCPTGSMDVQVGDTVSVKLGSVEASDKDASFGFGKRPTQFTVLAKAEEVAQ